MGAAAGKIQSEKARHAEDLVNAVESIEKKHPGTFGSGVYGGSSKDARFSSITGAAAGTSPDFGRAREKELSAFDDPDSPLLFTRRVQSIASSGIDTPEIGVVSKALQTLTQADLLEIGQYLVSSRNVSSKSNSTDSSSKDSPDRLSYTIRESTLEQMKAEYNKDERAGNNAAANNNDDDDADERMSILSYEDDFENADTEDEVGQSSRLRDGQERERERGGGDKTQSSSNGKGSNSKDKERSAEKHLGTNSRPSQILEEFGSGSGNDGPPGRGKGGAKGSELSSSTTSSSNKGYSSPRRTSNGGHESYPSVGVYNISDALKEVGLGGSTITKEAKQGPSYPKPNPNRSITEIDRAYLRDSGKVKIANDVAIRDIMEESFAVLLDLENVHSPAKSKKPFDPYTSNLYKPNPNPASTIPGSPSSTQRPGKTAFPVSFSGTQGEFKSSASNTQSGHPSIPSLEVIEKKNASLIELQRKKIWSYAQNAQLERDVEILTKQLQMLDQLDIDHPIENNYSNSNNFNRSNNYNSDNNSNNNNKSKNNSSQVMPQNKKVIASNQLQQRERLIDQSNPNLNPDFSQGDGDVISTKDFFVVNDKLLASSNKKTGGGGSQSTFDFMGGGFSSSILNTSSSSNNNNSNANFMSPNSYKSKDSNNSSIPKRRVRNPQIDDGQNATLQSSQNQQGSPPPQHFNHALANNSNNSNNNSNSVNNNSSAAAYSSRVSPIDLGLNTSSHANKSQFNRNRSQISEAPSAALDQAGQSAALNITGAGAGSSKRSIEDSSAAAVVLKSKEKVHQNKNILKRLNIRRRRHTLTGFGGGSEEDVNAVDDTTSAAFDDSRPYQPSIALPSGDDRARDIDQFSLQLLSINSSESKENESSDGSPTKTTNANRFRLQSKQALGQGSNSDAANRGKSTLTSASNATTTATAATATAFDDTAVTNEEKDGTESNAATSQNQAKPRRVRMSSLTSLTVDVNFDLPENNINNNSIAINIEEKKGNNNKKAIISRGKKTAPVAPADSNKLYDLALEAKWAEVSFMLRKPLETEADMHYTTAATEAGYLYMDQLTDTAKTLQITRGALSRWILPYDNNTRIDEQCSTPHSVWENIPEAFRGKITERQIHYLVAGANSVRKLVRVKIADDNDLDQAKEALKTSMDFFKLLQSESAR